MHIIITQQMIPPTHTKKQACELICFTIDQPRLAIFNGKISFRNSSADSLYQQTSYKGALTMEHYNYKIRLHCAKSTPYAYAISC